MLCDRFDEGSYVAAESLVKTQFGGVQCWGHWSFRLYYANSHHNLVFMPILIDKVPAAYIAPRVPCNRIDEGLQDF
jgi:hypothetical protein